MQNIVTIMGNQNCGQLFNKYKFQKKNEKQLFI